MPIKKTTIVAYLLLIFITNATGQTINRPAFNKNLKYLEMFAVSNYKGELNDYDSNYVVKATFNIDKSGRIINLNFRNQYFIPEKVLKYIQTLIFNEDEKWLPEIENCKVINSHQITFIFWLSKKMPSPIQEHLDKFNNVLTPNNYNPSTDNIYEPNAYGFSIELPD